MAGVVPNKPGSASYPFFGIDAALIDPVTGVEIEGNDAEGVLAIMTIGHQWQELSTRTTPNIWIPHEYTGYYFYR